MIRRVLEAINEDDYTFDKIEAALAKRGWVKTDESKVREYEWGGYVTTEDWNVVWEGPYEGMGFWFTVSRKFNEQGELTSKRIVSAHLYADRDVFDSPNALSIPGKQSAVNHPVWSNDIGSDVTVKMILDAVSRTVRRLGLKYKGKRT